MKIPGRRMKTRRLGWVLLAAGLFVDARQGVASTLPQPATGAAVDETRVQKTYYVDAANADSGNDEKHGTADAPFNTISYACRVAVADKDQDVGAKVIILPGIYREVVEIHPPPHGGSDSAAPLVIESAERGQAVIDGADTEGWNPSTWKIEGFKWSHPWPFRRDHELPVASSRTLHVAGTLSAGPGEACRRGDLIFINGDILRQVNRMEELAPGCFFGAVTAVPLKRGKLASAAAVEAGSTIFLQPPAQTELPNAIIQVGTRDHELVIHGRRNIVVRGLLLQHAAGPSSMGAATAGLLLDDCANVLVEDVLSQWNDGVGLVITGRMTAPWSAAFTLRQVHLLHNGSSGLTVSNVKNLLVEDSEASFNNFRGEWANWIDEVGPAGVKTGGVHGSTWRHLRAVGNFCRGVWWDGNDSDATLEESVLQNNVVSGLAIENDPGPVLVRRSLVANTKTHSGARGETTVSAGISINATPDVTLESNVLAGNAVAQLGLGNTAAHNTTATFEPLNSKSALYTEHHTYHQNVFYGADASQASYMMPTVGGIEKSAGASYYATLDSKQNCFWNPARADVFRQRATTGKAGSSKVANGMPGMNLENWRQLLSLTVHRNEDGVYTSDSPEADSLWQDPLFTDPSEGDFRVLDTSPASTWNLPSEDGPATP